MIFQYKGWAVSGTLLVEPSRKWTEQASCCEGIINDDQARLQGARPKL